jgi:putative membrane protein
MKSFFVRWFCTSVAVAIAVRLTPMSADNLIALLMMSLVLGIVNALIRPVLSLPFIFVTLGLFILVINALMIQLAGGIVPGFHVGSFGSSFFGAIIISVVNWGLSGVFKDGNGQYQVLTRHDQLKGMKQVEGREIE